jgi:hypothetical protein
MWVQIQSRSEPTGQICVKLDRTAFPVSEYKADFPSWQGLEPMTPTLRDHGCPFRAIRRLGARHLRS